MSKIVIDNGSFNLKVGIGGEEVPDCIKRTVLNKGKKNEFKFDEMLNSRESLVFPIKKGKFVHFEFMEKLWDKSYKELEFNPKDSAVVLTESILNDKKGRNEIKEIMFEVFEHSKCLIMKDVSSALFASGRTSGILVSSGHEITYSAPLFDGILLEKSANYSKVGGNDLTLKLLNLLNSKKKLFNVNSIIDYDIVNDIKEKYCYISNVNVLEDELEESINLPMSIKDIKLTQKEYKLPDGTKINLFKERTSVPELLFTQNTPISILVKNSISQIKDNKLYGNIVTTGGTTSFNGFNERLKQNLMKISPQSTPVKVINIEDKINLTWLGCSIISELDSFNQEYTTIEEYKDQ